MHATHLVMITLGSIGTIVLYQRVMGVVSLSQTRSNFLRTYHDVDFQHAHHDFNEVK